MINEVRNPARNPSNALDRLARVIRIVSVPPLMVAAILTLLWFARPELFTSLSQLLFSQCFLALVPILAYPLSYMIPAIRKKGRDGQRSIAMYLSAAGYLSVVLYGLLAHCTEGLRVIHLTYLLSVVLLLVLNKIIRVRASGHACSVSGPILLLCLYVGTAGAVTGVILWSLIFWASLRGKHHTAREYLIGSGVPIVAYLLAASVYMLV